MSKNPLLSEPVFSCDDSEAAHKAWDFNCGPGAIAAVVRMTPDELRPFMGDFERKYYTNPTLMFDILKRLGVGIRRLDKGVWPAYGLVRIQWHGRWMNEGVPMAARYRHTHWIAHRDRPDITIVGGYHEVFDINCMGVGGWIHGRNGNLALCRVFCRKSSRRAMATGQ